jgi:DNA-binding XRE family transcriptional regulator
MLYRLNYQNKVGLDLNYGIKNMENMMINGTKLQQLRQSKNMSRWKLSLECDISPSTIEKIEKGERSGLCVAYKLAKYFNVTIEDLI